MADSIRRKSKMSMHTRSCRKSFVSTAAGFCSNNAIDGIVLYSFLAEKNL